MVVSDLSIWRFQLLFRLVGWLLGSDDDKVEDERYFVISWKIIPNLACGLYQHRFWCTSWCQFTCISAWQCSNVYCDFQKVTEWWSEGHLWDARVLQSSIYSPGVVCVHNYLPSVFMAAFLLQNVITELTNVYIGATGLPNCIMYKHMVWYGFITC